MFILLGISLMIIVGSLLWFFFYDNNSSSSVSFDRSGTSVATVTPKTTVFSTDLFSISLPDGWAANGKKSPYSNQSYYEFQNNRSNNLGGILRVYVDLYPSDYPVAYILPVTVTGNKMIADKLSGNCATFSGVPPNLSGNPNAYINWTAKWQGVSFTCDMSSAHTAGTASIQEGYGVTIKSSNGSNHKYFLEYNDSNSNPNYQVFIDAVTSFVVL